MSPDYERAAVMAAETLVQHHVSTGPVDPFPILKSMPHVMLLSFAETAGQVGTDRDKLLASFGAGGLDAVTSVHHIGDRLYYVVIYNQRMPFFMLQRSLARELGHIVLGHDGSRPEDVRMAEAQAFAFHLICPRALVRAVQDSGLRFSVEVLGNMTGCFERCLSGMSKTPGVRVPAHLNRAVRQHFTDYLIDFIRIQSVLSQGDDSRLAEFGSYMDYYEE